MTQYIRALNPISHRGHMSIETPKMGRPTTTVCPRQNKSRNWRSKAAPAFILMLFWGSQSVHAQQLQWCGGQITTTYVHAVGNVYIMGTWLNDYQQICNLDAPWNGVSVSTCKGWLSLAELAVTTGKNVTLQIIAPSCSSIPNYERSPAPVYIMLRP